MNADQAEKLAAELDEMFAGIHAGADAGATWITVGGVRFLVRVTRSTMQPDEITRKETT